MNGRVSGILVVALLVSGAATYLVYRAITSRGSQTPQAVTVVRAARSLEIGTLLRDSDLTTGLWVGPVPAGMATKKEPLLGRGVVAAIYEGEPIMDSRLAATGAGAGLAATIPSGMRAVAVRVNDIVGVAGFAQPGMRVDVLIAGVPPNGQAASGPQVKTILQNIEVLSAGQNYQKDAEGKPVVVQVVNLLVDPQQAETLSLASNETRIQLVLRNPLDTQTAKTTGTSVAGIFGTPVSAPPAPTIVRVPVPVAAVKPPPPPPPIPPLQIEVFNGATRSEAKFAQARGDQPLGEKK
jgi:pilus assembly protein CpaB